MPGFLKKVDQKLLLNKPDVWSTRTHLVLYYGILFILLLAGLCFLEIDARPRLLVGKLIEDSLKL